MKRLNLCIMLLLVFAVYVASENFNVFASIANLGVYSGLVSLLGRYCLYLGLIFVVMHSLLTLGRNRTVLLFALGLGLGFFSEYVGVVYGWVFGPYYYSPGMRSLFGVMAFETPISWALIIYISYWLASIIAYGSVTGENEMGSPCWKSYLVTVLLSAISGLCAMNIDMILDPVAVTQGAWTWIGGGPFFGIPISNFVGWFMVAFLCTLIYRFVDLQFKPFKTASVAVSGGKMFSLLIISVYSLYLVKHVALALSLSHPEFALVGTAAMLPLILISLLKLISDKTKKDVPLHA